MFKFCFCFFLIRSHLDSMENRGEYVMVSMFLSFFDFTFWFLFSI